MYFQCSALNVDRRLVRINDQLLDESETPTKITGGYGSPGLMVVISGLYSSIRSQRIDTRYSEVLDQDVRTLKNLTRAKALAALFGQLLYADIAEMNTDNNCTRSRANWTKLTPITKH